MRINQISSGANSRPVKPQKPTKSADSIKRAIATASSPDKDVPVGALISENKNANPKLEKQHWQESEAQLFGGVERKSQMHPGSSLFITAH
jgi:hypothetical protein